MGYTKVFAGKFKLSRRLTEEENNFLLQLSKTRRVKRDNRILEQKEFQSRQVKKGVSLELFPGFGEDGEFFIGSDDYSICCNDNSVVDSNTPPANQPGLWLKWIPGGDKKSIVWNESEKTYDTTKWMGYLIQKIFIPWGITASGIVYWKGTQYADIGFIQISENKVEEYDIKAPIEDSIPLFKKYQNHPIYGRIVAPVLASCGFPELPLLE